jgi:superfamily II DNA or RNA helicase/transcriptional regulator with XRE-family HTH domain
MSTSSDHTHDYARIVAAERDHEHLAISFANGDVVRLRPQALFGPDADTADWQTLTWDQDQVSVETASGLAEAPWDSVRAITDTDFATEMVLQAKEHARRIGVGLRLLRESRGLSSKEVAQRASIAPQSMSRIELGRHDVVFTTLEKILGAMDYNLRDLALVLDPDPGPPPADSEPLRANEVAEELAQLATLESNSDNPGADIFDRSVAEDLSRLDDTPADAFKEAVASLLVYEGFSNVAPTPDDGDFGAELLAIRDREKVAIHLEQTLRPVGVGALRQALGGVAYWDAASGAVVTNSYFTTAAADLADNAGLVLFDRTKIRRWFSRAQRHPPVHGIAPYPHQTEVLSNLAALRESGHSSALVVMASGLGKTVIAALDVAAFEGSARRPSRVLYLSHQSAMLHQTRRLFERVFGAARTYGEVAGSTREGDRDFVFATFQTMSKVSIELPSDAFDYVIVDEAHHTAAPTRDAVVRSLKPRFLLGLTATPFRGDGKDVSEYYGDVHAAWLPLERAIAENLLTPVDYRVVSDRVDEGQLSALLVSRESGGRGERDLFSPVDDRVIVDTVMSEASWVDGRRRILGFCASLGQMAHFAELIPDARTISGQDTREKQVTLIEELRAGQFEVLLSRDVLNEGIDVPHVSTLIFLRNTESATVFNQQLGRGLRKADGKDRVDVFDFVNTLPRLEFVYQFFSRLDTEQRVRGNKRSAPKSSLTLDDGARSVVAGLLAKKRSAGTVVGLGSLRDSIDVRLSDATFQRMVADGRLVPDYVLPERSGHQKIFFENRTVKRFMRQVHGSQDTKGLLSEREIARRVGSNVAVIRREEQSGRLPAAWIGQLPSGKLERYFAPDDVDKLATPA